MEITINKTTAPKAKPANAKGKNSHRNNRPRPVEPPRSRVKDSTEQPSLMKPYYLYDDDN